MNEQLLKLDVVRVLGVHNVLYNGFILHVRGLLFMTAVILPSHDHLFCCFKCLLNACYIFLKSGGFWLAVNVIIVISWKNCSESNSNNINPLLHYDVDFPILIELEQLIKMYSYCYSYCPCEQAFIQQFILHGVGRPSWLPLCCHHMTTCSEYLCFHPSIFMRILE